MEAMFKNSKRFDGDQPSHYEFEPFDSEKPASKLTTGSTGEYEMPVMDAYDLHAPNQKVQAEELTEQKDNIQKQLELAAHIANGVSIVSSGVTAIGSGISSNDKFKNLLQSFSSFGAKLSMGVNSIFNIYNGHKQKDIANIVGYAGESLAALIAPYEVLGLVRGATSATYQATNLMANIKPMEESKTYGDYISQFKDRYPKLIKKLFKLDTYKNFSKNSGTITGGWGNLLSYAGVLGWAATGSTKLGGWIKGLGEVLIDSYQILPEQWGRKKHLYITSGMAFIMGSLSEIISKQKNNDPVTMALYFFGSGIGRMFLTLSNIVGENKYKASDAVQSPAAPFQNIFDISKILNFGKSPAAVA